MTQEDIVAKLSAAGIHFENLDGVWFRESGGDMGELLTGIVVDTEADYFAAAKALGVSEADAKTKLSGWSVFHLPDLEDYPISVSFWVKYDEDDDEILDSGNFSFLSDNRPVEVKK